jgi:hypothetical protein
VPTTAKNGSVKQYRFQLSRVPGGASRSASYATSNQGNIAADSFDIIAKAAASSYAMK